MSGRVRRIGVVPGDRIRAVRPYCAKLAAEQARGETFEVVEVVVADYRNGDGPVEVAVISHDHHGQIALKDGSFTVPPAPVRHYLHPSNVEMVARKALDT